MQPWDMDKNSFRENKMHKSKYPA